MTIYLLSDYNKYSDRILKNDDISDLSSYICHTATKINFSEGDGVSTTIVLNKDMLDPRNPDYLIACAEYAYEKESRWFILSAKKLRTGQTEYQLRRDLIHDNLDFVKNSTLKVNRGYVSLDSPYIYKPEDISVNEILQSNRTTLTDDTGYSWAVAYIAKKGSSVDSSSTWDKSEIKFGSEGLNAYETFSSLDDFKKKYNDGETYIDTIITRVPFQVNLAGGGYKRYEAITDEALGTSEFKATDSKYKNVFQTYSTLIPTKLSETNMSAAIRSNLGSIAKSTYDNLIAEYGSARTVKIGNVYYQIKYEPSKTQFLSKEYTGVSDPIILEALSEMGKSTSDYVNGGTILVTYVKYTIGFTTEVLNGKTDSLTLSTTRRMTNDAQYDIVFAPYRHLTLTNTKYNPDACKNLIENLSVYLGSSCVYDAQLLPYCPVDWIDVDYTSGDIRLEKLVQNVDYTISTNETAILFYADTANRSFTIRKEVGNYIDRMTSKVDYVTKKYTIVAPNFSNEYKVPAYENGGVDFIHVDQTLLPYSPWIKLHPRYANLNGANLEDNRGLILGGSFNLTMLTNAWSEYVYNNANYSQLFDSQIAYQEYQNKMSLISSGISSVSSAISTGATVGTGLSIMPGTGAFGAVAGTIAGGVSLAAGIADLAVQKDMTKKAIEYETEQYNLSLGNIKSQPSTISKITAFNINSLVWPVLNVYDCTDEEKEQVENYFEYNSYRLDVIGHISDYVKPSNDYTFISGSLLRTNQAVSNATQGDYNYISNINSELQQGIYMKGLDL